MLLLDDQVIVPVGNFWTPNNIQYSSNREDDRRLRDKILELYFPTGRTQHARKCYKGKLRKMAVRGLPTNNIPAVMAAAAGYILAGVNPATLHLRQIVGSIIFVRRSHLVQ